MDLPNFAKISKIWQNYNFFLAKLQRTTNLQTSSCFPCETFKKNAGHSSISGLCGEIAKRGKKHREIAENC